MIIELLTPMMIATAPDKIDLKSEQIYDHKTQIVVAYVEHGIVQKQEDVQYSSTRTYDGGGNPKDADWD